MRGRWPGGASGAVPLIVLVIQKGRGVAAKDQFLESLNEELGLPPRCFTLDQIAGLAR